MGLRAASVSGETHLRLEGCGRKGLISHWGFWTEPLGGFREWWQRVAAGSEERRVRRVTLLTLLVDHRCSLCLFVREMEFDKRMVV